MRTRFLFRHDVIERSARLDPAVRHRQLVARSAARVAACVLCLGLIAAAPAQNYPARPVRLIVPNAPGGANDILGRQLARQLQRAWGQPVIVENKPGAGTVTSTEAIVRSAPDGYTLGMVVTSHVINPSLRKLPYDTLHDLAGVSLIAVTPGVIEATLSLPANNLPELIALAKRNPGQLSYASPGSGSSMHLAGELLKSMAGIDIVHVPYKGSGPAYPDVIAGRVALIIEPLFAGLNNVRAGKTKAIAVISARRAGAAADIPAVAETVPGFSVDSINGIAVPGATPRALVHRISADFAAILRVPELRAQMSAAGLDPVGGTPEEFDAFIRAEIDKWSKVVKASGASVD